MLKTIPEILLEARASVRFVNAELAAKEMTTNGGAIIDVREPAEVEEQGDINSLNIPRGILEMKVLSAFPDCEKYIYLHCATGARATFAAEQLQRLGYQQIAVISSELKEIQSALATCSKS